MFGEALSSKFDRRGAASIHDVMWRGLRRQGGGGRQTAMNSRYYETITMPRPSLKTSY